MRRALALLVALLVAAVPAALARPAHHHRCKHHHRRCHRPHRSTPHPGPVQPQPVTPAPGGSGTAGTGSTGPVPASGGQTGTPQGPATPPVSARIGVVTREYSLSLSRSSVPQGSALVQLQNFGEDPHNLRIERVDGGGTATDFAQAGTAGLETQTVALSPGIYKLYCTLPGHDALGMHATLTVGG